MQESCFHCGDKITNERVELDEKVFCCNGCKTVFEIISGENLTDFYQMNVTPGLKPKSYQDYQFDFLDSEKIFNQFVDFSDGGVSVVNFYLPVIHCSSCIWLLESLDTLNPKIIHSVVDFPKKEIRITFRSDEYKLSELAKFITLLGYKPMLNLTSLDKEQKGLNLDTLYKMVVAGFCFGNSMLLAFPEYITSDGRWIDEYKPFFRWGMLLLSLPVMFYSSKGYFKSAYKGLQLRNLNIDVPISLGILTLFFRSVFEVTTNYGAGYFDSFCGLVFFMLVGKIFQESTYRSLSFDRDYKSFYPIAVTRIKEGIQENILLKELLVGDRILLRNEEILPADAVLIKGTALIDNSFVTGESILIEKTVGDLIYAGGRQSGSLVEVEVVKAVNQSYLTQLWNHETFKKEETQHDYLVNRVSKYFTIVTLLVALSSGIFWYFKDVSQLFQVVTAVLIVACPCALSLSTPFALGNMLRYFGLDQLYLKDIQTLEKMAGITQVVFDKTGTITENEEATIDWNGSKLSQEEERQISTIIKNSNHPLSRILYSYLQSQKEEVSLPMLNYREVLGKGVQGEVAGLSLMVGSADFVGSTEVEVLNVSVVFVKIDQEIKGYFGFTNKYREGIEETLSQLNTYQLSVISGDNESEKERLEKIFPSSAKLYFNQSPKDKLLYIKGLQEKGEKVLMIGDGLNDAGALKQSDVGIAVADNANSFSPSCDGIIAGKELYRIAHFLRKSQRGMTLVKLSFLFSILYNLIGLIFAVTGNLRPVVAAILMPISSISIVILATLGSWLIYTWNQSK